jgi:hypothetical protein
VAGGARDTSQHEGKMGKGPDGARALLPDSAFGPRARSGAGSLPKVAITCVRGWRRRRSAHVDVVRCGEKKNSVVCKMGRLGRLLRMVGSRGF